jgi:hypothetical protein
MFSGIYGIFFVNYSHTVRTRDSRKNEADSPKEDSAGDPEYPSLVTGELERMNSHKEACE